jgi:hypothetical protein
MVVLGFQRSSSEHGVYTRWQGEHMLIVGVYVDDLVITGSSSNDITQFKTEMQEIFRMSNLGLLSYYLSIGVHQSDTGITLRQAAYANKLLEHSACRAAIQCLHPWNPA